MNGQRRGSSTFFLRRRSLRDLQDSFEVCDAANDTFDDGLVSVYHTGHNSESELMDVSPDSEEHQKMNGNLGDLFAGAANRLDLNSDSQDETSSSSSEEEEMPQRAMRTRIMPSRSTKPLTIPKEFNFASRQPVRQAPEQKPAKKPRVAATKKAVVTVPKPFNLQTNFRVTRSLAAAQQAQGYKPLAALVKEVENATPERFKKTISKKQTALQRIKNSLTQPKSPMLATRMRAKAHHVPMPQEENKTQFKATRLNRKILDAKRPLGVPAVRRAQLTVPESPALMTKHLQPKQTYQPSPPRHFKANPIRKLPKFQVKLNHEHTEPQDFALPGDAISRRKREQFEQQVADIYESLQHQRQFRANPLPYDEPDALPEVAHREVTQPVPFRFETDLRGEFYQLEWQDKLFEEEVQEEIRRRFRAQPLPNLDAPFVPKKSTREPTEPEPVLLHTDARMEERRQFDEAIQQRLVMEDEIRRQLREEYEAREQQEIRQLRRQLVHQAQPVRHYAPVRVKPSQRQLTQPMSPFIGAKRRGGRVNKA